MLDQRKGNKQKNTTVRKISREEKSLGKDRLVWKKGKTLPVHDVGAEPSTILKKKRERKERLRELHFRRTLYKWWRKKGSLTKAVYMFEGRRTDERKGGILVKGEKGRSQELESGG